MDTSCNALAAENDYMVMYDGGSIGGLKAGNKVEVYIKPKRIRLVRDGRDAVDIPASTVTEITYGEDAHRRVGAATGLAVVSFGVGGRMSLTKSKKHFVGLTWADGCDSTSMTVNNWRVALPPRASGVDPPRPPCLAGWEWVG